MLKPAHQRLLVAAEPQPGHVHRAAPAGKVRLLREYGFVHDVWVEEPYRNEGLARQMVTLAVERFRAIGVEQVRLDVLVENAPARSLFEACGFRPAVIEMLLETTRPAG